MWGVPDWYMAQKVIIFNVFDFLNSRTHGTQFFLCIKKEEFFSSHLVLFCFVKPCLAFWILDEYGKSSYSYNIIIVMYSKVL